MTETVLPLALCAACGAALSIIELLETFGRWMGRFWLNRYVLALVGLNTLTAGGVYVFLRYVLEVNNSFWLAAVTGLTFPALLRSNFTFYRALRTGEGRSPSGLSLRVHDWYCRLEQICYQETNGQIADARAILLMEIGRRLRENEILALLTAHIASELLIESRKKHIAKLQAIQSVEDAAERLLRLAALMVEVLPEQRVQEFARGAA
jgi:hypothetical protein